MVTCYLGLGSNLHSPLRQLRRAIKHIESLPRTSIKKISQIYLTAPLGPPAQPNYYNLVMAINTTIPPHQLLTLCGGIEKKQHRVKKKHWGPRTIDIDILLYGNQIINDPKLTIPHPEMLHRDFVLQPLLEITVGF